MKNFAKFALLLFLSLVLFGFCACRVSEPAISDRVISTPEVAMPFVTVEPSPEPTPEPTSKPAPNLTPDPTPEPVASPTTEPSPEVSESPLIHGLDPDTVVYVSSRSHTIHSVCDCSGMKNYTEMTISEADEKGYKYCPRCW